MWKFVTRGIRESLERRVCRTNVYSQNSDETVSPNQQQQQQQQEPLQEEKEQQPRKCFVKELHKELKGPCLLTFARHFGTRCRSQQRDYEDKCSWSEAFGWSGVLALGYVVCQSIFVRRSLFDVDNTNVEKWKQKLIVNPQAQANQIISYFILPRPQYIFPVTKDLVFNKQQSLDFTEDISKDISEDISEDSSEDLVDGAVNIGQTYGPITAEEALKEAIEEFSYANEIVLGELEFNSGILAVEEKRFKDAVKHFSSGVKMSSVRSMFNLGLCYELGLGTPRNFKKAAEYYAKAAEEGHADAMYNLGVYFAQGKGGIGLNLDTAKYWFTEAAERGQLEAIKALQIEESFNRQLHLQQQDESRLKIKPIIKVKTNAVPALVNYKNMFTTSIDTQTESDEFSTSSDNLSSPSPTDMFLEMIGVHKPSAMPLMVVREHSF